MQIIGHQSVLACIIQCKLQYMVAMVILMITVASQVTGGIHLHVTSNYTIRAPCGVHDCRVQSCSLGWLVGRICNIVYYICTCIIMSNAHCSQDKCFRYWPAQGSQAYGKFEVTTVDQDSNSNWTVTNMQIKNLEVCGGWGRGGGRG